MTGEHNEINLQDTLDMAKELNRALIELSNAIRTSSRLQENAVGKLMCISPSTFRHVDMLNRPDLIEKASKT